MLYFRIIDRNGSEHDKSYKIGCGKKGEPSRYLVKMNICKY